MLTFSQYANRSVIELTHNCTLIFQDCSVASGNHVRSQKLSCIFFTIYLFPEVVRLHDYQLRYYFQMCFLQRGSDKHQITKSAICTRSTTLLERYIESYTKTNRHGGLKESIRYIDLKVTN